MHIALLWQRVIFNAPYLAGDRHHRAAPCAASGESDALTAASALERDRATAASALGRGRAAPKLLLSLPRPNTSLRAARGAPFADAAAACRCGSWCQTPATGVPRTLSRSLRRRWTRTTAPIEVCRLRPPVKRRGYQFKLQAFTKRPRARWV